MYRMIDVFAGIGGIRLAFENIFGADAVNENAAITFALCNRQCRRINEIRQVASSLVVGAEVFNLVPLLFEIRFNLILERGAGVVVSHCNFHLNSSLKLFTEYSARAKIFLAD